jgi:hypothetical protein
VKLKYHQWLQSLLFIAAIALIATATSYTDNKELAQMALYMSFISLSIYAASFFLSQSQTQKLKHLEDVELSHLREIRRRLKSGEAVSENHISISDKSSSDCDKEFLAITGFNRPLVGITASTFTKLEGKSASDNI